MTEVPLFDVYSYQGQKPAWKRVASSLPRNEAAQAVKVEWNRGRFARVVPIKKEIAA